MHTVSKFIIATIGSLIIVYGTVNAQEDQAIIELFRNYIAEINNLDKSKSTDNLKKLLSPDFVINQTQVALEGNIRRFSHDREEHLGGFREIYLTEGVTLASNIERVLRTTSGLNTALIIAEVKANISYDGKVGQKVTNFVNAIGSQTNGEWKLTQIDNVTVPDERTIGNCPCRFYERGNGFATELAYPSGLEYETKLDVFTIRNGQAARTIKMNKQLYNWKSNGEVMSADEKEVLGTTNTPKEAVTLILAEVYKDRCIKIIAR